MMYVPLRELYAEGGLIVYTDGSCSYLDKVGGWAYVATDIFERTYPVGGAERDTTISRMELTAPLMALLDIYEEHGPSTLLVISDSEYVVLGVQDTTRKRNKNVDLWVALDEAIRMHEAVEFQHTRGHAGDAGNEEADKVAGEHRRAALYSS